jgi:Uma2 family endonuclease
MAMAAPIYFTRAQVRAMPAHDGTRYELAYGELLVTPAPSVWHEVLVARIRDALSPYVQFESLGMVFGRGELEYGAETHFEPDLLVLPLDDIRRLVWAGTSPLLIVEVLSPSSARFDRFTKRVEYQRQGVPAYWIVDGENRRIEVWTPGAEAPVLESEALEWHPSGDSSPFRLELAELFRPV